MKSRTATITRLALALMLALLPITAAAQGQGPVRPRQTAGVTVPIDGQIATAPGGKPSVPIDGTFTLQRFAQQDDALVAIGTVTLTFTDNASGETAPTDTAATDTTTTGAETSDTTAPETTAEASRTIVSRVAIPVNQEQLTANCPALHVVLDPVDLNLLGLTEHVNQVALDVTAVSERNQLGTLICSAATVLNGTGTAAGGTDTGTSTGANASAAAPLGRVVNLLNQILDVLG
jgi:hypothetical protein